MPHLMLVPLALLVLQAAEAAKFVMNLSIDPHHPLGQDAGRPREKPRLSSDEQESVASLMAIVEGNDTAARNDTAVGSAADSVASLMAIIEGSDTAARKDAAVGSAAPGPGLSPAPGPGPAPEQFASGPGPGPAPAAPGGPAPGPAPLAMDAASPWDGQLVTDGPQEKPDFTKRLVGVDYYLLKAKESLRTSFETGLKTVLASQVEGGLEPKDVTLRLSNGSVVIDAWFANPRNLSVLRRSSIQEALCRKTNLDSELLAAVSRLPKFHEVTTRKLYFDKAPQCVNKLKAKPASATKGKQTIPAHKVQASNTCDPPCMEGRGICGDKVCFCHHPYTGAQCEKEIQHDDMVWSVRISWIYVCLALSVVACMGMVFGECIWRRIKPRELSDVVSGEDDAPQLLWRKEQWHPTSGKEDEQTKRLGTKAGF